MAVQVVDIKKSFNGAFCGLSGCQAPWRLKLPSVKSSSHETFCGVNGSSHETVSSGENRFRTSHATHHEQPTTTSPSTTSTTSDPATKPRSGSHANESMEATAGAAVQTRIRWIRHHHCRGRNYDRNRPSTSTNTTATPTSPTTTTAAPPESLPLRRMMWWPGI